MNSEPNHSHRVCVYCASSDLCDDVYKREAYRLGVLLAQSRVRIVYGGGGRGLMGQLAAGALACGGHVTGIMPRFMQELEWGHTGLSELQIVEDMRERKHRMLAGSNAAIALPGGCGTLEELLEAITLKRLGIYDQPIVIVNQRDYFAPLLNLLDRAVRERFMEPCHLELWQVAKDADEAVELALPRNAAMGQRQGH
ncbi:MAG TPA: TIGR00730 family Rossman fold protein [Terriglobales bacterium]|nr:TIGR00730 family Rossman fold protein [Terriglobales bacterium]